MKVLGVVAALLMILTVLWMISLLPSFWQALVLNILLFGGAISFLCTVAIRVWRPEKLFSIFSAKT